jgi:hypothetical protein
VVVAWATSGPTLTAAGAATCPRHLAEVLADALG